MLFRSQGKIEKLNHFHDQIIDSEVFLRLDKSSTHENKIAEIRINIPGKTIFAKEQSKSFEEAADTAVDALRRQIVKHREKEIGE